MDNSRHLPPATPQPIYYLDEDPAPKVARDYARYRSWSWHSLPADTPWASAAYIHQAVNHALEQRGVHFLTTGSASDLQVRIELRSEQRLRQPCSSPSTAAQTEAQGCTEEVVVLHVQMFDSQDGQVVWNVGVEMPSHTTPDQRAAALEHAIQQTLSAYPPT